MFFFSVLDERAHYQKKHVFFVCPARALDCCRFPKKIKSISGDKKFIPKKVNFKR